MIEAGDLVRVVAPHFVAALVMQDGRCVEAAPILQWARGLDAATLRAYFRRRGWRASIVSPLALAGQSEPVVDTIEAGEVWRLHPNPEAYAIAEAELRRAGWAYDILTDRWRPAAEIDPKWRLSSLPGFRAFVARASPLIAEAF